MRGLRTSERAKCKNCDCEIISFHKAGKNGRISIYPKTYHREKNGKTGSVLFHKYCDAHLCDDPAFST